MYQQKIIIQNQNLLSCTLSAEFHDEPLKDLFETLKIVFGVELQERDHVIYISSGSCTISN